MIVFDQFKVPTIKFGKGFAEFMIPIALLKKFGSSEFVTIIEVSNMRRCSGKANKLRYCRFGNFHVAFISRIFHFQIIHDFLNSRVSIQLTQIAIKNRCLEYW